MLDVQEAASQCVPIALEISLTPATASSLGQLHSSAPSVAAVIQYVIEHYLLFCLEMRQAKELTNSLAKGRTSLSSRRDLYLSWRGTITWLE